MHIIVHIMQAFCDGGSGGNAAGVVLDADRLSPDQKLHIAKIVGLSETAFVSQSNVASIKVEFFTPTRQIPHCGHATVAAFALCRRLNRLSDGAHSKESIDGVRNVYLSNEQVTLEQPFPSFEDVASDSPIGTRCLHAMTASMDFLASNARLTLARAGNAFLLVPLASEAALAALVSKAQEIFSISQELDLIGFYPYCVATTRPTRTVSARMFAPLYGIQEESATGSAAGPLGAHLLSKSAALRSCVIEQGHFMHPSSPSLLSVSLSTASGSQPPLVLVSGEARPGRTIEVEV